MGLHKDYLGRVHSRLRSSCLLNSIDLLWRRRGILENVRTCDKICDWDCTRNTFEEYMAEFEAAAPLTTVSFNGAGPSITCSFASRSWAKGLALDASSSGLELETSTAPGTSDCATPEIG